MMFPAKIQLVPGRASLTFYSMQTAGKRLAPVTQAVDFTKTLHSAAHKTRHR
jgi:hypothetical protein